MAHRPSLLLLRRLGNPASLKQVTRSSTSLASTIISPLEQPSSSVKPTEEQSPATTDTRRTSAINPVPDFTNARVAYESKSTAELLRAAALFTSCKFPFLVKNAETLLKATRSVLGGTIADALNKATLYGHFCAGEDEKRIRPVLNMLDQHGIGSILDYAAESDGPPTQKPCTPDLTPEEGPVSREYDYESEAQCDAHVETFIQCIHTVANSGKSDGYAAIKITALGNPKLLARMSQAIVETRNLFTKFDANNDGYVSRDEFELGYK
jgi:proline dehydrogenase